MILYQVSFSTAIITNINHTNNQRFYQLYQLINTLQVGVLIFLSSSKFLPQVLKVLTWRKSLESQQRNLTSPGRQTVSPKCSLAGQQLLETFPTMRTTSLDSMLWAFKLCKAAVKFKVISSNFWLWKSLSYSRRKTSSWLHNKKPW